VYCMFPPKNHGFFGRCWLAPKILLGRDKRRRGHEEQVGLTVCMYSQVREGKGCTLLLCTDSTAMDVPPRHMKAWVALVP
jgi:hypothetical protein